MTRTQLVDARWYEVMVTITMTMRVMLMRAGTMTLRAIIICASLS